MSHNQFSFFYGGPFSQFAHSPFTLLDFTFSCCEQWMMFNKAMVFKDGAIAEKIVSTTDPWAIKRYGRQVANFDDDVWMERAYDIVLQGNRAKFQQNSQFYRALTDTVGKVLVEASPTDRRWGIGLSTNNPLRWDPSQWRGTNLLGQVLTELRVEFTGEAPTDLMLQCVDRLNEPGYNKYS